MDATKRKDADKESANTRPEDADEISAKKPEEKGPLWQDKSDSGRVHATIWSHPQKAGRTRFSIGICRSYFDDDKDAWVNTFYFERQDLNDIIAFALEAKRRIDRLTGEPDPD
jgi:hypothetical protein